MHRVNYVRLTYVTVTSHNNIRFSVLDSYDYYMRAISKRKKNINEK